MLCFWFISIKCRAQRSLRIPFTAHRKKATGPIPTLSLLQKQAVHMLVMDAFVMFWILASQPPLHTPFPSLESQNKDQNSFNKLSKLWISYISLQEFLKTFDKQTNRAFIFKLLDFGIIWSIFLRTWFISDWPLSIPFLF